MNSTISFYSQQNEQCGRYNLRTKKSFFHTGADQLAKDLDHANKDYGFILEMVGSVCNNVITKDPIQLLKDCQLECPLSFGECSIFLVEILGCGHYNKIKLIPHNKILKMHKFMYIDENNNIVVVTPSKVKGQLNNPSLLYKEVNDTNENNTDSLNKQQKTQKSGVITNIIVILGVVVSIGVLAPTIINGLYCIQ